MNIHVHTRVHLYLWGVCKCVVGGYVSCCCAHEGLYTYRSYRHLERFLRFGSLVLIHETLGWHFVLLYCRCCDTRQRSYTPKIKSSVSAHPLALAYARARAHVRSRLGASASVCLFLCSGAYQSPPALGCASSSCSISSSLPQVCTTHSMRRLLSVEIL
jgi:hypothetical protein